MKCYTERNDVVIITNPFGLRCLSIYLYLRLSEKALIIVKNFFSIITKSVYYNEKTWHISKIIW